MNIPENLKYHREHTWLRLEGDIGTMGITDFAQKELGEIVFVELPNIGKSFVQNEVFGSIEAIKTVSDLFVPISGEVIATNSNLLKEPTLVNSDPYGNGWMIRIKVSASSELFNLMSAEEYGETTKQ